MAKLKKWASTPGGVVLSGDGGFVVIDDLRARLREIAASKLPREGIKNLLAELA